MTFSDFLTSHSAWFAATVSSSVYTFEGEPTPVPTLRWLGVCAVSDGYPYPVGVDLHALAASATTTSADADAFTLWFFVTPAGVPGALVLASVSGHPTWDVL